MSGDTFLIVILASLFHAVWNSIVRRYNSFSLLIAMSLTSMLSGLMLVCVLPPISSDSLPYLLIGAFFHIGARFTVQVAYSRGDMAQIYPIVRGSIPIITAFLSVFVGEHISFIQTIALAAIALGVVLLAFRGGITPGKVNRSAVGYCLLTASCAAAYTLIDGLGARIAGSALSFAAWIFLIDGAASLAITFSIQRNAHRGINASDLCAGFVAGTTQLVSFSLAIYAMLWAPIALVAAVRETSLIFGMAIAAVFLKEALTFWRVVGAGVIMTSLFLLQTVALQH